MPGYEPFLLCDFHVHTTWSDGQLNLKDVIDLYGRVSVGAKVIVLPINPTRVSSAN